MCVLSSGRYVHPPITERAATQPPRVVLYAQRKGQNAVSQPTTTASSSPQLIVRIKLGGDGSFGPGKAELLERIDRLGSISAAARAMRMSYRQAWMLLDTMNQAFQGPLVETSQGGPRGGGAAVTPLGKRILAYCRALQRKAAKSAHADLEAILGLTAAGFPPAVRKRPGAQSPRRLSSSA